MKRVMVVEDDATLSGVLEEFLVADGYEVAVASDGQVALDELRRGPRPDLLVVDINMPVLGGASLVHALRNEAEWEAFARVPIIVVSGLWDVVSFDLEIQAGFTKPLHYDELRAKVRELLASGSQG